MKKLSKITVLLLVVSMFFSLVACSGGGGNPASSGEPTGEPSAKDTYKVGICQLAPHVALDAATQGFMDALNEALPGKVEFDLQNAAGETPTCTTIVNRFVAADVDLIMANATASLQAAAAATGEIPILGTSITEYGAALGLTDYSGVVGGNISGTSDLADLELQAAMVSEWFPETKTVGLLYCSAEANSIYQVTKVKEYLEGAGLTAVLYPFSDSNDMASVTQSACGACDVLYIPTDNVVANNTGIVDNICRAAKIPVITGDEGTCSGCGVATLALSYYDLGVATGKMAAKILTGEADISTMPVEYVPSSDLTREYNAAICADLGITPLEGYKPIGE